MAADTLLRTPLYDWHVAHGGRMVDFAGWLMPIQYSSIIQEHLAIRSSVGIADISHMGRLRFEGPGAAVFLAELLTRRVRALRPFTRPATSCDAIPPGGTPCRVRPQAFYANPPTKCPTVTRFWDLYF